MGEPASVSIEADWLPPAELQRLLEQQGKDIPDLAFSVEPPDDRFIETAIAVALIVGTVDLLVPFLSKLADRLFRAKPNAALTLAGGSEVEVTVSSATRVEDREGLITQALASGAAKVRITVI